MPNRVEILKQRFANSVGLPFRELLPESSINEVLKAEKVKYRNRLFNPIVTLWAFLSQVLDTDKAQLPHQVRVREVHLLIRQKGFRPHEIIIVTTLVDSQVYTKAKLAQLVPLALAGRSRLTPCKNYFGYGNVAW